MTYPATFYARTLTDPTTRPTLQGAHDTDTVIIGGGLAGLTTALELAQRHLDRWLGGKSDEIPENWKIASALFQSIVYQYSRYHLPILI